MEYIVVGNSAFVINDEREIKRVDGNPTDLPETDVKITISLYGYIREVEKEWLYWLSYFKLELPVGYEEYVYNFEFKDIFSLKHVRVDPKMVLFKKPVYLKTDNNYRLIARFPKYAISTSGVLYNIHLSHRMVPRAVHDKYVVSTIVDQAKLHKASSQLTHRLVAMAWVANDDYSKYYLVDHIDGDKTNCHYTNLRWANHKQNNTYTSEQGVRSDNIPVMSRNMDTGEIKEHASITQASEYIGRSRINSAHTPITSGKIWSGANGRFELKLKTDTEPWFYITKSIRPPFMTTTYVTVKLGDEVFEYTSIKQASVALLAIERPLTIDMFEKKIKDKYPNAIVDIAKAVTLEAKYKDGTLHTAESMSDLAKLTNVSKSTVQKYVASGKCYDGWLFRYKPKYDLPWVGCEDVSKDNDSIRVDVKDITNGEIETFESVRAASRKLNVDKTTILKSLNGKALLFNKYLIFTHGPVQQ